MSALNHIDLRAGFLIFGRNYAVCVATFIALFSLSWWWIGAKK